jgi:hypothetical protein
MNTPPTSILPEPGFDPSWSLFDQNSIQFTAEPYYQQGAPNSSSSTENPRNITHIRSNSLENQEQQGYENSESWGAYEHPIETWPSNLIRLFGTTFQQMNNNDNHLQ